VSGSQPRIWWVAWLVLVLGLLGAIASVRALWHGDHSDPNFLAVLLVFMPYIVGGMLLQITGKARLTIIALFLPALLDLVFGLVLTLGGNPGWQTEILWRAIRSMTTVLAVPIALGIGIWMERDDARRQQS
jgi:peptidoglycan/LPS O-acetylase OafA/YrhL